MAKADPQGGEFGTMAYDATMHPANAGAQAIAAGRIQNARDIHLLGDKTAAARIFSHVYDGQPSVTAVRMMGLATQRDIIEAQVQRTNDHPFPGVPLGHTPGFHAAPRVNQVQGVPGPMGHHAHRVESKQRTRLRFGRG